MRMTLLLAAALALGLASPAHAAFNVCNKTSLPVRTAIARFDGTSWVVFGEPIQMNAR